MNSQKQSSYNVPVGNLDNNIKINDLERKNLKLQEQNKRLDYELNKTGKELRLSQLQLGLSSNKEKFCDLIDFLSQMINNENQELRIPYYDVEIPFLIPLIESYEQQINDLKQDNLRLQEIITGQEKKLKIILPENIKISKQLTLKSKQVLEFYENHNFAKMIQYNELKELLVFYEEENEEIKNKFNNLTQKNEGLIGLVTTLEQEKKQQDESIKRLSQSNEKLQVELSIVLNKYEKSQNDLNQHLSDISNKETKYFDFDMKLFKKDEQIKILQRKQQSFIDIAEQEYESSRFELNKKQKEIEDLILLYDENVQQSQYLRDDLKKEEEKNQQLQIQLDEKQKVQKTNNRNIDLLNDQIETLNKNLQQNYEQSQKKDDDLEENYKQIRKLEHDLYTLEQEKSRLDNTEKNYMDKIKVEKESFLKETEYLKGQLEEKNLMIQNLWLEKTELQETENLKKQEQVDYHEEINNNNENKIQQLEYTLQLLNAKYQNGENLTQRYDQTIKKNFDDQNNQLKYVIDQNQRNVQELEQQIENIQKDYDKQVRQNDKLYADKKKLIIQMKYIKMLLQNKVDLL